MAILKVIKPVLGWNIGDHVEATGDRLEELVSKGLVEVIKPDEPIKDPDLIGKEVNKSERKSKKVSK